jgi:UDP-N-acetylglucosamine diphosphorylase/glucosamine-1-phosphate N-acetyltransferase
MPLREIMLPPIYVFEDSQVDRLYPLTYTRAAFELRVGALTLLERLERNIGYPLAGVLVRPGLADVVRNRLAAGRPGEGGPLAVNPPISMRQGVVLINARWLLLSAHAARARGGQTPDAPAFAIPAPDTAGISQSSVVWMHISAERAGEIDLSALHTPRGFDGILAKVQRFSAPATLIDRPWDLLEHQRAAILEDFAALGAAAPGVMPGAHLLEPAHIHLGEGVRVWPGAVLDAQGGPIVVEQGTEIRANAVITGPVAIGRHCVIRTGADIREECSFGPGSRVGGEVIGSLFLGNGNKQHHGFLGQSIVGEWANLGAGTTTSNLKNTYGNVRVPLNGKEEPTGRLFMGSLIGDHAKLGIGTYLSTGSVVGFGSHVVVGRPPRFVPSFAWLTEKGMERADFEKIEQIAATVMKRRGAEFTAADHELFVRIASEWSLAEEYRWPE